VSLPAARSSIDAPDDCAPPALIDAGAQGQGSTIRILFCCDPGYYQHLAAALVSLHESNQRHQLDIHLITAQRDAEAEARLVASIRPFANSTLRIHTFSWSSKESWFTSGHITADTYTRIFAPDVLDASIERILYLDADLLVVADLEELWATDLEGCALAAVVEPYALGRRAELGIPESGAYINAGVLLLDLARWRARGHSARLAAHIEQEGARLKFHDQDALNALLHAETKILDYRWNFQARMFWRADLKRLSGHPAMLDAIRAASRRPAVIHYTTDRKPWRFVMAIPKKQLYHRYRRRTPWREARPADLRWSRLAERIYNYLMFYCGSPHTWDWFLRATNLGRVVYYSCRLTTWLFHDAWRSHAPPLTGFPKLARRGRRM
jgi:lipopolysaccharide biosynthesis glycosyltransferase